MCPLSRSLGLSQWRRPQTSLLHFISLLLFALGFRARKRERERERERKLGQAQISSPEPGANLIQLPYNNKFHTNSSSAPLCAFSSGGRLASRPSATRAFGEIKIKSAKEVRGGERERENFRSSRSRAAMQIHLALSRVFLALAAVSQSQQLSPPAAPLCHL